MYASIIRVTIDHHHVLWLLPPTSMNLPNGEWEFRILCEEEPIPKRRRLSPIRFRSSVVCILFLNRCKRLIRRKWLKELGLRKPKSFERSFASCEKAKFWNYRLNHWVRPSDVGIGSQKKMWIDCPDCAHTYDANVDNMYRGAGCTYCCVTSWRHCLKQDCTFCFERSFASHPKSVFWSSANAQTPIEVSKHNLRMFTFDCDKCGHAFQTNTASVSNGNWCPFCSNCWQ